MTAKARVVWFLRVFYERSSSEIARHPSVGVSPPAVDAMLLRCRKHMRTCMTAKSFDPERVPVGTLTILWDAISRELGDDGLELHAGLVAG